MTPQQDRPRAANASPWGHPLTFQVGAEQIRLRFDNRLFIICASVSAGLHLNPARTPINPTRTSMRRSTLPLALAPAPSVCGLLLVAVVAMPPATVRNDNGASPGAPAG